MGYKNRLLYFFLSQNQYQELVCFSCQMFDFPYPISRLWDHKCSTIFFIVTMLQQRLLLLSLCYLPKTCFKIHKVFFTIYVLQHLQYMKCLGKQDYVQSDQQKYVVLLTWQKKLKDIQFPLASLLVECVSADITNKKFVHTKSFVRRQIFRRTLAQWVHHKV